MLYLAACGLRVYGEATADSDFDVVLTPGKPTHVVEWKTATSMTKDEGIKPWMAKRKTALVNEIQRVFEEKLSGYPGPLQNPARFRPLLSLVSDGWQQKNEKRKLH